jgi:hypothetical protein
MASISAKGLHPVKAPKARSYWQWGRYTSAGLLICVNLFEYATPDTLRDGTQLMVHLGLLALGLVCAWFDRRALAAEALSYGARLARQIIEGLPQREES